VTGVDTGDFDMTTSGTISSPAVTGVTGGPTSYTVMVNTGSGNGTIRLNMRASATIADTTGNLLVRLPYTDGETYTIDKILPTVVSILRASSNPTIESSVDFTVTLSKIVTGVDAGDFSLTTTGILSGTSISNVSGSGTIYTVTVNTGIGYGTLRLNVIDNDSIVDGAGNPLGGPGAGNGDFTNGETYTVDKVVPTVVSSLRANSNPTNESSVDFTVTFSETVTGVDAGDFSLTTTGILNGTSISNVSGSGTIYTITVNTGIGYGTLRLNVIDNDSIVDGAGNPLGGPGAGNGDFTSGEMYDVRFHWTYLPLVLGN
jgi:hypothetical protein